jgi:hypothetical protein
MSGKVIDLFVPFSVTVTDPMLFMPSMRNPCVAGQAPGIG